MKKSLSFPLLLSALVLLPSLAQAHPGHLGHGGSGSGGDDLGGGGIGALAGFTHPFTGLDHLLAMVAVGMWAAQLGGRARWAVPTAFVATMTVGSTLGMFGFTLPAVELAIFASVVMLGLLVAAAAKMRLEACLAAVGFFALFHGLAHGAEIPVSANGFAYTAGFIVATAALHALGFAIATGMKSFAEAGWVRAAGGAIAVAGAMLIAH